jgi:hypothetical protein
MEGTPILHVMASESTTSKHIQYSGAFHLSCPQQDHAMACKMSS